MQFDAGLVMRGVSTPRVLDEARRPVVRHIPGAPSVDWLFRWQGGGESLKLYGLADADHAADDEGRRSVSCSQEFLDGHRQTCVAIGSAESEFHALTLCVAWLIFTKSLVHGFGFSRVEGPTLTRILQRRGVLRIVKALGSSSCFKVGTGGTRRMSSDAG